MIELRTSTGERLTVLDTRPRRGGESRVYRAGGAAGRDLAVKVALLPHPYGTWLDRERALLEELAADPRTEALVVEVRGHGTWNDRPFLVMDWYERSLDTVVAEGAPPSERLRLCAAAVAVLERLRAVRPTLVHGDIKPSNLLIAPTGTSEAPAVRLADFGSARELARDRSTSSVRLFSPGYAAPEQIDGAPPSARWDDHGIAATVFACVTGSPPLGGPGGLASADRAALRQAVRGDLERVLAAALHPRPERRSLSHGALRAALEGSRPAVHRARPRVGRIALGASASLLALALAWPRAAPPAYSVVPVDGGGDVAPFLLGAVLVDQALWHEVTGESLAERRQIDGALGSFCDRFQGISLVGDELPMVCIDWWDAARFANALSEREGLEPAYELWMGPDGPDVSWRRGTSGYRLLTAAEWDHVTGAALARAIADPEGACARENTLDASAERAWSAPGIACDDGFPAASPVGHYPADERGLHDLVGNVATWMWDPGPEPGTRTANGVGWGGDLDRTVAGPPGPFEPGYRYVTMGLRLARDAP